MERELILVINMKSTDDAQTVNTFETRCSAVTRAVPDFVDVTDQITDAIVQAQIRNGRAIVFVADDSCSLMVNERESGLLVDLARTIERLKLSRGDGQRAVLGASSLVLPVVDGKLKLGTWQRVQLIELTEAGERSVAIQIVGER